MKKISIPQILVFLKWSIISLIFSLGHTAQDNQSDPRTIDTFQYFKGSNYQQRRFLEGLDLREWTAADQGCLIKDLIDPANPPRWIELKNGDSLKDEHFIPLSRTEGRRSDGDTKVFVASSLKHLSVDGCTSLTPRFFEYIFSEGKNLTYLDISHTHLSGNITIELPKLRSLKMNAVGNAPSEVLREKITIRCPCLKFFECNGSDLLDSLIIHNSFSQGNSSPLEYVGLRNMALLDNKKLDNLLFEKDVKGKFIEQNERKKRRFPRLRSMDLEGTKVTFPKIRGYLPDHDTDAINRIRDRINHIEEGDAVVILEELRLDTDRITNFSDFSYHTSQFLKNSIGGIAWDLYGLGKLFKAFYHKIIRAKNPADLTKEIPAVISTSAAIEGGLSGSTLYNRLLPEAAVVAFPSTSALTAATIVGGVLSGGVWLGRAAYWEHQRINEEIQFAQHVFGLTLRAAINKTEGKKLDLSDKGFGDSGVEGFMKDKDGFSFGCVTNLNLSGNGITDKGGKILRDVLKENKDVLKLNIEKNDAISVDILTDINEYLSRNKLKSQQAEEAALQDIQAEDVFLRTQINRLGQTPAMIPYKKPIRFGLSIDGGGMRGLIPSIILEEFQHFLRDSHGNKEIYKLFDCIGGSSIGGILALGLTIPTSLFGYPMTPTDLTKFFKNDGPKIFGSSRMSGGYFTNSKHDHTPLEEILNDRFKEKTLSNALTHVVITGVRIDRPNGLEPFIFDSKQARVNRSYDFFARHVARATSAAPKYFQPASFRDMDRNLYSFWDGGVWQNNPSQLVFNRILECNPEADNSQVKILSLGTGAAEPSYIPIWSSGMRGNIRPLIFGQMDLSQEGVTHTMTNLLESNYMRVQPKLRNPRGKPFRVEMDNYSPEILEVYQESAQEKWREYESLIRALVKEREDRKS